MSTPSQLCRNHFIWKSGQPAGSRPAALARVGFGRPHREALQSGCAPGHHHPQSQRLGHRAGLDEIRSDGGRDPRHGSGGCRRRADRQPRRHHHPTGVRIRPRPDDLRADFEISVPADAELQIHDDSGGVNVSNVLGDMNVETIAAGVDLEDAAGYLTVKTVGGSFQCLRCAGRIEVSFHQREFQAHRPAQHLRSRANFRRQHPFQRRIPAQWHLRPEELQRRDRSALFARRFVRSERELAEGQSEQRSQAVRLPRTITSSSNSATRCSGLSTPGAPGSS